MAQDLMVLSDGRRSAAEWRALVKAYHKRTCTHSAAVCTRRCTQIKVLAFEAGGYCLWSKRLEVGQFARLGREVDVKRTVTPTEFIALLEGVDMLIKKQRKRIGWWLPHRPLFRIRYRRWSSPIRRRVPRRRP